MTKKDYELIAATLQENNASEQLIAAFADALKQDNARFDRAKFTLRCMRVR